MPLSLNQIQSRIRSLALSHKQINHFYFGDVPEFDSQEDIIYPACFCELLPGRIDSVQKIHQFNFRLFFVDLVHVSERTEENETEVLSDMAQVAGDLYAMLKNPLYQYDWEVIETATINPVTESLGDMVAGVYMDIGLNVDYLSDSCVVPADDVEFDQTFNMARTKLISYNASGSEGNSWNISALSTKNVIAAWRSGYYKRIRTTTPDTEEIQLTGVDLGDYKGIVTTGDITLAPGDAPIVDEKFDFLIYD